MQNPKVWTGYIAVIALGFTLGYGSVVMGRGRAAGFSALVIAAAVHLCEERRRAKANLVKEAWERAGYNLTSAAATMQMDISECRRMLLAERSLDEWRLEQLGPEFLRWRALLELQALGLPALIHAALKIAPLLDQEKKTA